jgi:hypothetical protein
MGKLVSGVFGIFGNFWKFCGDSGELRELLEILGNFKRTSAIERKIKASREKMKRSSKIQRCLD